MLAVFLRVENLCSIPSLLRVFTINWCLILSNVFFFGLYWYDLMVCLDYSVTLMDHTDWFLAVKILNSWKKPILSWFISVWNYPWVQLANIIWGYMISDVGLQSYFFVMSLPSFLFVFYWPPEMSFEVSSPPLWQNLGNIHVIPLKQNPPVSPFGSGIFPCCNIFKLRNQFLYYVWGYSDLQFLLVSILQNDFSSLSSELLEVTRENWKKASVYFSLFPGISVRLCSGPAPENHCLTYTVRRLVVSAQPRLLFPLLFLALWEGQARHQVLLEARGTLTPGPHSILVTPRAPACQTSSSWRVAGMRGQSWPWAATPAGPSTQVLCHHSAVLRHL